MLMLTYTSASYSQKPPIDTSVMGKWPYLDNSVAISNDGHYVAYVIGDQPPGSQTLVVRSTDNSWAVAHVGAGAGIFSTDSRRYAFQNGDTLFLLTLGTDRHEQVTAIASCKWPRIRSGEWLAYQLKGPAGEVVLRSLVSEKEKRFPAVTNYFFARTANVLVMATAGQDSVPETSLRWVDLKEGMAKTIWSHSGGSVKMTANETGFDAAGDQFAFLVGEKAAATLWYYKTGMGKAIVKVTGQTQGMGPGLSIVAPLQFSANGRWLFFGLQAPADAPKPRQGGPVVEIWSYKDTIIQPEQRRLNGKLQQFLAVVGIAGDRVIRVEREGEQAETSTYWITGDATVVLGHHNPFRVWVEYWQDSSLQTSIYLLNLQDGSRKLLKERVSSEDRLVDYTFSPHGRWLAYFDLAMGAWYCVDTRSGATRNVSRNIPARLIVQEVDRHALADFPVASLAGWLGDSALLVYDEYDIWRVDPAGNALPVNITNGYGRRRKIILRVIKPADKSDYPDPLVLLSGFRTNDKYNGFYRKDLRKKGDPDSLIMGPYCFYHDGSQIPSMSVFDPGMPPIKAAGAEAWIVKRQDAHTAPNYFATRDFKTFTALTNLQPQQSYNWLTDTLIRFKQLDGTPTQAILYRPEDFDSRKKYPVIFNYYEELSYRLYEFPYPQLTSAEIDIPWFVSHGYLVCTPDIHYRIAGRSGIPVDEWAYNSVLAAARYLSAFPYVDSKRMGIQGHSFGGGETNYIVTHSTTFAAAAEMAGVADPISSYLTLVPFVAPFEHASSMAVFETGHSLYGANPWQRPDVYRRNSAVLNADKVTAPLLIVHNPTDNEIQWRQGLELYMALRRLGKKAWMLEYDNEGHTIRSPQNAVDYTIRLSQFFDHYLKGMPAPVWMTRGIPARLEGIEMGYEPETDPDRHP